MVKIIQCGVTDGVYDDKGRAIARLTPRSFRKLKRQISGSGGVDVTGGMYHKVKQSLNIASRFGVPTRIINGRTQGNLKKAIISKEVGGTVVAMSKTGS